ncbi:hypothetical protein [Gilvimarinus algae]|uniref:HEPN domain-containing protein n=1 Tax=Gilvimarinus algae TaxID=3058037 RepID=A0ABT8THD5_9GAMM|nr:hypothetical protein [Gilvimarinus sp. SDUM040014]MDO3383478.1 hypothetical protein [Gilvimarinus sp. SDUM040014]
MDFKEELVMAPRMIEDAYKFYKASQLLAWERNMMKISQINAALSIEILLKSFFSEVTEHPGEVYARYRFDMCSANEVNRSKDAHDLLLLAKFLPERIQSKILTDAVERMLEKYRATFTKDRYGYESQADRGASTILSELAGILIDQVVSIYKEAGCQDPWIRHYPNV